MSSQVQAVGEVLEDLEFYTDASYSGCGLSAGLTRGIQIRYEGRFLTQEGMGIGTIALKRGGLTYFCRKMIPEPGPFTYTASLDTVLSTSLWGRTSRGLSHLWHWGTGIYRRLPDSQPRLLALAGVARQWLRIENRFETARIQGNAWFQATLRDKGLDVRCVIRIPRLTGKVCIMNELGAEWFTAGWSAGAVRPGPPPWEHLDSGGPYPSLYAEKLGLLLSLEAVDVAGDIPYRVFWGREHTPQLCWAGYTVEIDLKHAKTSEVTCTYRIGFEKLKKES